MSLSLNNPSLVGVVGGLDNPDPDAWNIESFTYGNVVYDPIAEGEVVNATLNSFVVSPDGTHAYLSTIVTGTPPRIVHEYSMSVPYSLATLTWIRQKDFQATTGLAGMIRWNLNGTKMFLMDLSNDTVDEYALSTGWDISTSSFTDGFNILDPTPSKGSGGGGGSSHGFCFNEDGTKLFALNALNGFFPGSHEPTIYRYSCSAFDVSTCTLDSGQSFEATDYGPNEVGGDGIEIRDDGTMMWIWIASDSFGPADINIRQYNMSTPYDLSTMSTTGIANDVFTDVLPFESLQRCVHYKRDGFRAWGCGSNENLIRQFNSPQ